MQKNIVILLISLVFIFIFGTYLLLVSNSFTSKVKDLFPDKLKYHLKETFFVIPHLKQENAILKSRINHLEKEFKRFRTKSILENENFLGFKLQPIIVKKNDETIFEIQKFQLISAPHDWLGYELGNTYRGRYLEKFKENIILIDYFTFYKVRIENILDEENLNFVEINTNLKKFQNIIGIRDLKVIENTIFITALTEDETGCYHMQILSANLEEQNLTFKNFYNINFKFCLKGFMQSGARIEAYDNENIILSIGDFNFPNWVDKDKEMFSDLNMLGKIVLINRTNKEIKILSKGHRNPQGLIYLDDQNIIISTEHGPKGGDEINVNYLDKVYNFGWPIASYGVKDNGENPFVKNHKDFNFDEPHKFYVPSIAIGQIIKKNNDKNTFLFTSLRANSIFKIKFDNDYNKINFEEKYFVGERIRDILHLENNLYAVILDSSPSLGVFNLN